MEHKHKPVLDPETQKLFCQECKQTIMTLEHLQELQKINKQYFEGEIDLVEFTQQIKDLKGKLDATQTN